MQMTFDPASDRDIAVKLALCSLLLDSHLADLQRLLDGQIEGLAGDPGWELERASDGTGGFIARVDPDIYWVEHPEIALTATEFREYIAVVFHSYKTHEGSAYSNGQAFLNENGLR